MGVFAVWTVTWALSSAGEEEESAAAKLGAARIIPLEPLPGTVAAGEEPGANGNGHQGSGARVVPLEPLPEAMAPAESRFGADSGRSLADVLTPKEIQDVELAVREWAASWSDQRVDDYLRSYARDFRPPEAMTRDQWRAHRQARVSGPRFVSITLGSLKIGAVQSTRAWSEFVQSYQAPSFSDTVVKRLDWVREEGIWRIAEERVISVIAVHGVAAR